MSEPMKFKGVVDEVAFYSTALSRRQIRRHWRRAVPLRTRVRLWFKRA